MLFRSMLMVAVSVICGAIAQAADVTIHVTGGGNTAKYIKEGDSEQKDVTVKVDQTVKWSNDMMTNAPHTATSTMKDVAGVRIFDTKMLAVGASKEIKFTRALFTSAGGSAGGKVELEYFCQIHGSDKMKSKIIIDDSAALTSLAGQQSQVVPRIVTVKLTVSDDGKSLQINATGEVPTAGYANPHLVMAVYLVPPVDGMQDIFLTATPPSDVAAQVVSQIEATTSWKDFKTQAPWLKGVRVHGVGTGTVEKLLP